MTSTARHARRKRGSLSAEEILGAAMALLDRDGVAALTFNALGAELKASPTAVYRHFASRHDLLVAIADHLDGLSLAGYEPSGEWRADLRDLGWRAWRTATSHPAASSLAMTIVTGGVNELRAVDAVLEAVHQAGFEGAEAVLHYQAFANTVLGTASSHAARLSGLTDQPSAEGWVQAYEVGDVMHHPHVQRLMQELRVVDYDAVFEAIIDTYIAGLATIAQAQGVASDSLSE
ncbi:TetR/AcrR family transcriptional regulator [Demequina zhanjiangensis]|uniref:TetR/AcrR family transcriptional regulator n=1 Tax=Demequina zhanjiangensis TaxID=3051659 RepID=A0ABT8G4S7_9MICO|nr:TetR/AcrR family transcriptional regulator [Demequina sp. SYSU T00b26]MDN4474148.1 TetR/AcrR family transcriptional regulator [Demequina sp. SYSU T00b26]